MKKLINTLCRSLCALMLCTGLVFVGCTDGPLGDGTEQGTNQNNGNGAGGGNDVNDGDGNNGDGIGNENGGNDEGDINGPANLSKNGTANSYIVSASGTYNFTPTKGNSAESVGQIASVEVLWESFGTDVTPNVGDLVNNVNYENGVISFETPAAFKEGNAVIAAKDASGTILWSWHIWLTDQPQGQVYYNDAGIMMDRNLGATSATPGDVGALGLLYQWGRKDPFLGSSSISSDVHAKSTIAWPSAVLSDSSCGTIEYAIAHPTTFIFCQDYNSEDFSHPVCNYDWYYTGSREVGDTTRWTDLSTAKSIYDPCPIGWRVPDGVKNTVWAKALGSSECVELAGNYTDKGMNFFGKFGADPIIWYPITGVRYRSDGELSNVGELSVYWSASCFEDCDDGFYYINACGFLFAFFDGYYDLRPSMDNGIHAHGNSVRCIKE